MIHPTARVHRLALVEDSTVGAETQIWQFASVIRKSVIGEKCTIAATAIVDGSRVGDRCIISHGAFIDPGIDIGNQVFIGPQVSLCNDLWPMVSKKGWFDIRDLISGAVVVTRIDSGASVGANAVILPGVRIGSFAMIAAGAVVKHDVPSLHLFTRDNRLIPIDGDRIVRMKSVDSL